MNILHFGGLDMPIHKWSETEILVEKTEFRKAARRGVAAFKRLCLTGGPTADSLKDRIARAEAGFERLAELCGATVLPHEFALAYVSPKEQRRVDPLVTYAVREQSYRTNLVPRDHVLIAEVPTIVADPSLATSESAAKIADGVTTYGLEVKVLGFGVKDVDCEQIMHGRPLAEPGHQGEAYLIDIEPITTANPS